MRCFLQIPVVEDCNTKPQKRISTPKRKKDNFEALFKRNFKTKMNSATIETFVAKAAFGTLTHPLQCDLQPSAQKHNSITHAAGITRNLHAATPLRSANNELLIELCTHKLWRIAGSFSVLEPDDVWLCFEACVFRDDTS